MLFCPIVLLATVAALCAAFSRPIAVTQRSFPFSAFRPKSLGQTGADCRSTRTSSVFLGASSSQSLPEIKDMKAGDMKRELESYGISTKSFFEKTEFIKALEEARAAGKQPKASTGGEKSESSSSGKSSSKSSSASSSSRQENLEKERKKAAGMKVGELKKELESRGVSTRSFFEKTEFVNAYAEAVVDGVQGTKNRGGSGGGGFGNNRAAAEEEPYDSSYRDVTMQKMDPRAKQLLLSGKVIDVTLGR